MALFKSICKSYIARLIIAIVVNAVNRVAFFAAVFQFGNMRQESWKVMSPFIADRDAPTAVVFVIVGVGVCASLDDVAPYFSQGSVRHSMRCLCLGSSIPLVAAARTSVVLTQARRQYGQSVTARTMTKPLHSQPTAFNGADGCQSSKKLTGKVFGVWGKDKEFWFRVIEWKLGLYKLWGMLAHVNSPFSTLTTPPDGSNRRGGNLFPAFIVPQMNECGNEAVMPS